MNVLGRLAFGTLKAYARVAPTQRGGYRLVRMARRLIPRRQWQGRFNAPGAVALDLDLSTYPDCCMACGLYELDTLRVIRRLLRPGMHFVDVGANIGYFTLAAARLVGPAGRVDAVEPDPLNRSRLEEHLQANGAMAQVRVRAAAASDAPGTVTLYHPTGGGHNHGEASIIAGVAGEAVETYSVPAARLDELVEGGPDLVKMDIEGAELRAIGGTTRLLGADRPPRLIIEHNVDSARAAGHEPGDLLRAIRRVNSRYVARWIGWRMREMSAEQIDAMGRQGNILYEVAGGPGR
jgi:FkbM family methyltransferase